MNKTEYVDNLSLEKTLSENCKTLSNYLYKNELLNAVYFVEEKDKNDPFVSLITIGAPKQIIDMINASVNQPIVNMKFSVLEIPVMRRVYKEKKPIYYKRIPDLVSAFIPALPSKKMVNLMLNKFGITDMGLAPVFITLKDHQSIFLILCVLGPLSQDQRLFVKEAVESFEKLLK